jgi:2-polyprenyl-6-methoxyphenol hydroxylase-like FAD-dependent oxidoreductase
MPTITSALVVGGGVAGPVTAAALRLAGIDAHVVEAYPDPDGGIGGSLAIAANGLAALDVLGAGDAVRAVGLPIAASRMTIGGTDLGTMPALAEIEPMRMVRRGDLHRVLRDAAVAAGARSSYGRRLVRVEEAGDRITAVFEDGGTEAADVLVGADGVRSTVRRLIDPAAPGPTYTGLLGFEGSARIDGDGFDGMTFAFGSRAYYLYWPEPDGTVVWGGNLPSKQYRSLADARRTPAAEWLEVLRDTYRGDEPGGRLVDATPAERLDVTGAIHIMPPVPHWHRGRMVLVGDAVHAPSNSTGQGASLAIESAVELARALRDGSDVAAAFTAYESLRRPRVEAIARRGARINSTKTPGPVARRIMRAVMPVVMRRMDVERTMGPEQRYRIDWEAPLAGRSR